MQSALSTACHVRGRRSVLVQHLYGISDVYQADCGLFTYYKGAVDSIEVYHSESTYLVLKFPKVFHGTVLEDLVTLLYRWD